ncbi:iron ABC transporter permease [Flavobacteriaceae bacterium S356]|uniref:Iron ABC transporter permease n=1 Tax=Asprobacillus argus TaxID=3076534 RepID=A0ABU3LGB1_9FLAO|nr:iron ABC transporter permease [Flavobacteriaceae bacterium S356]
MATTTSYTKHFIFLSLALILIAFVNVNFGSVSIPSKEIMSILFGDTSVKESWEIIILNFRVPKAITAILVGSGLSISGLLMQTLFRNPLAGPFVLGISSGASLGVALLILGAGFFGGMFSGLAMSNWSLAIAASAGAGLVLLAVMLAANKVRNTMSILIIGLMFGSLSAAFISVLSYFSEASEIQQYIFWGFGSLGNLSWEEIGVFAFIFSLGILGILFVIKPLNSLLLGENYAKSLGINIKKSRNIILVITSILTGVITAFAGPIAFIGLAVPHMTKLVFKTSNHKILIPAVAIVGAIILLICDMIAQLPTSEFTLPINAITSLFGAPIVIWLLIRKKKIFV